MNYTNWWIFKSSSISPYVKSSFISAIFFLGKTLLNAFHENWTGTSHPWWLWYWPSYSLRSEIYRTHRPVCWIWRHTYVRAECHTRLMGLLAFMKPRLELGISYFVLVLGLGSLVWTPIGENIHQITCKITSPMRKPRVFWRNFRAREVPVETANLLCSQHCSGNWLQYM